MTEEGYYCTEPGPAPQNATHYADRVRRRISNFGDLEFVLVFTPLPPLSTKPNLLVCPGDFVKSET